MHRTLIAAVVVCLASVVAASAGVSAARADARAVSHGFFKTVFGLEYGGHADANRVKRYVSPVRFHISDRSGRNRLPAARQFIRSLPQRIHHLDAQHVARADRANFRVIIVKRSDFADVVARELQADAYAMNARCLVGVTTHNGRIERSVAVIIGDDDYLFSRCLVEEVLQGLGPMNDHASLTGSVFNDRSRLASFTDFDEAILNVLYHPTIRPGMTQRQARQALPKAMRELGYTR